MNDDLSQLKSALQTLALPVIAQVHLVEDDCARIEVLAEAFSTAYRSVGTAASTSLLPEQASALTRLDEQLAKVRQTSSPPLPSELAMRASSQWRQVRTMAREALIHFRWTLEVPPPESAGSPSHLRKDNGEISTWMAAQRPCLAGHETCLVDRER